MKIFQVWVLPLATMALFFGLLLGAIPYAAGYGWEKVSLGSVTWALWGEPDWGHAAFVPLICLALVAIRAGRIAQAPVRGSTWAAGWIALGIFLYCIGLKAEMQYFGFAAIQILLAGLILWFWGPKVFGLVSFAWLFLLFTWPMPFLDGVIALPLRLEMSHISCQLLNFFGTPCVQNGTSVLSAPNLAAGLKLGSKFEIDIADPCSGLHSLFALMMLSALAGYAVRILLLVWAAERYGVPSLGTEDNPSWYHLACGYAVYFVALALLVGLIVLLNSRMLRRGWAALHDALVSHPVRAGIAPATRTAD
jgi:exosortase